MLYVPTSDIMILENRRGQISVYWPFDNTGAVKYFNLYYSDRKTGTYTLIKQVPNAIGFSHVYVRADFDRESLGISKNDNFYISYRTEDWSAVEAAFDPANVRVVYADGIKLDDSHIIIEDDIQASSAVDVDWTTSDPIYGSVEQIIISRSVSTAITLAVYLGNDVVNPDLDQDTQYLIYYGTGLTDRVIRVPMEQEFSIVDGRPIRVITTGVSGGSLQIHTERKKGFLPYAGA